MPPTLALTNRAFGSQKSPVMFAWISASHQLGGAMAAFLAGAFRSASGSYLESFIAAGLVGLPAAVTVLFIGRTQRPGSLISIPAG